MPSTLRTGLGFANGTCGELAQGVLPDGTPFVVTCPIDRGTSITVRVADAPTFEIVAADGLRYLDRALRRTAELLELGPVRITGARETSLHVGKGMASSTAERCGR